MPELDPRTGIYVVPERDALLTPFARSLLEKYYARPGETPQLAYARAARAWCGGDMALAQRIYNAVSQGWFMFASPVLSNAPLPGEKAKSMPISCFLTYVHDSIQGLNDHTVETRWLAVLGGGVGGHWSDVRAVSDKAPGPIPFMHCMDADMEAFKQGTCYTPDTEVMTARGWVRFDALRSDDLLGAVSDSLGLSFETPRELVVENHAGHVLNIRTPNGAVDLMVTPNHSMVIEDRVRQKGPGPRKAWTGRLRKVRADMLPRHADVRFHTAVELDDAPDHTTVLGPMERFWIAFQADGYNWPQGGGSGFHFAKKRKIERLQEILNEVGIAHTRADGETTRFYINDSVRGPKLLREWVDLPMRSAAWCRAFLEELRHWDATEGGEGRGFTYMTTAKDNADMVQAIAALGGMTSRMSVDRDRGENKADLYRVYVRDYAHLTLQKVDAIEVPYEGKVYCALVSTGMLLVRRNGVVTVCGNTRKGSYAAYLDVSHPDILEFLHVRVPTGDASRKCLGTGFHNAVNITDAFMDAVEQDKTWDLIDPNAKDVRETVRARDLWEQILEVRYRTGEPYLHFIDASNRALPETQKALGLRVRGSNLCSEITLATSEDRTAVCCLSSLNAELYDEWHDQGLVGDLIEMLDNVLQFFIDNAPPALARAAYSARMERSLGLGLMGFHSYLQRCGVPFESERAREVNRAMFKTIHAEAIERSEALASAKGEAPDMAGTGRRNAHLIAIAPNANSSILLATSPSIEVAKANAYKHQTRAGTWPVKNRYLEALLTAKGRNTDEVWKDIIVSKGSVQHLDFLSDHEKAVFKTAIEIDQRWVIQHAADRQPYICQAQSVNLFFPPRAARSYFNQVHLMAWREGLKSLYYCRTETPNRAEDVSRKIVRDKLRDADTVSAESATAEECVACQG